MLDFLSFCEPACPALHSTRSFILRRKKDGDWYIYPYFLVHENLNNVHKNVQKSYNIFKPNIHNVLLKGTNIIKIWLSLCLIGFVRFARYGGKDKCTSAIFFPTLDWEGPQPDSQTGGESSLQNILPHAHNHCLIELCSEAANLCEVVNL